MARILIGSYMCRYPLGGNLSWALQFLKGFHLLGHDVYMVEKAGYQDACYDPNNDIMTNDCANGIQIVHNLFERFGLNNRWAFVDSDNNYFGLSKVKVKDLFKSADIFIDMGAHGSWSDEAVYTPVRVLLEGEPGYTQMMMTKKINTGESLADYDFYYTAGSQIGTSSSSAPDAGKAWKLLWNCVITDLFTVTDIIREAPFTTVMNWQSHQPIDFEGKIYGQKDIEFLKFLNLPSQVNAPMEIAVSGNVPFDLLRDSKWHIRDAKSATLTVDKYYNYITNSRGEFSVCKNVFVETCSGWFSDRSAAYLANGRPVILQDTGFSAHLPCGEGLFAVSNVNEAAEAILSINSEFEHHSRAAREIAVEYLDAKKLLRKFITELSN